MIYRDCRIVIQSRWCPEITNPTPEHSPLLFLIKQFRSVNWTGISRWYKLPGGECVIHGVNPCACAMCVWDGKKRGLKWEGEECLGEERLMLCQWVVLIQSVWVTFSHLCSSCEGKVFSKFWQFYLRHHITLTKHSCCSKAWKICCYCTKEGLLRLSC